MMCGGGEFPVGLAVVVRISPRTNRSSDQRYRQISNARQTAIGSALVLRPRYLAVLSICTCPKSARTVCKFASAFQNVKSLRPTQRFDAVVGGIESCVHDPDLQQTAQLSPAHWTRHPAGTARE